MSYRLSQGNGLVSKSATDKLEYGNWTKDKPSSVATQRPSIHTARSLRSDRARVRLGRYDEDITAEPNQEEPDLTKPDIQSLQDNPTQPEEAKDVPMPIVFKGPITRKRAKVLQHKFNESLYYKRKAAMGEETQAALMQAFRDLQEEMKNMRQELGGRMDRIEQRPAIRPQRRVDLGIAQANTTPTGTAPRRTGLHFNDIPEASNTHQQPEDDPGPFYPQNQNQRRPGEQDEDGEDKEEDYNPPPRARRWTELSRGQPLGHRDELTLE
ncbi:hypothetical protein F2Q69_00043025 [Brassica cretica]|uniref:Uncharacterized protein n=1 Tax=Brassica cretica TaxID=69181 RepID=A0A8S9NHI9_BRACR|nr:hypothetical protein F2Q69_00043025 [Brassica cretica]